MDGMNKRQAVIDQYPDEPLLFADGFDAAILGVSGGFDELRVVYSVSKILEILVEEFQEEGGVPRTLSMAGTQWPASTSILTLAGPTLAPRHRSSWTTR